MTELQQMLADAVGALFAGEVTPELLGAADRGQWPERLWNALAGAEYPRLFADGDLDVTWADAYPLVFAAGRALAPVPLPEMLLASWLLRSAGVAQPDGIVVVAPQRANESWEVTTRGGRTVVSGRAAAVPWAARAAHVLVAARDGARPMLALVDASALAIEPGRNAAAEPRDGIRADVAPALVAALPDGFPPDTLQRFGALVRATQIAGAVGHVLTLTAAYAKERHQFGRPIGSFQAISQQLAVLAEETVAAEMAAATAWPAATADPATRAIAIAKIRAGKAAGIAPAIAHAVFGAIGITAEHSLHFATRRLWSWRAEFGPEATWARDLGAAVLRDGGARLWPSVTEIA